MSTRPRDGLYYISSVILQFVKHWFLGYKPRNACHKFLRSFINPPYNACNILIHICFSFFPNLPFLVISCLNSRNHRYLCLKCSMCLCFQGHRKGRHMKWALEETRPGNINNSKIVWMFSNYDNTKLKLHNLWKGSNNYLTKNSFSYIITYDNKNTSLLNI